jgi:hypothetical protein
MSAKSLDEMEVGSPEWEAEVERLQIEEDAANAKVKSEVDETAKAEAEAAKLAEDAKAAEEAAKAAAEAAAKAAEEAAKVDPAKVDDPDKPGAPGGVLGKDGKTVLPYAALKGAREEARAAREEAKAARARAEVLAKEIEDLKSGKTAPAAESLTEEELAELTEYAPKAAKVIAEAKAREQRIAELEAQVSASTKPAAKAEPEDDPVQDAIDQVPMLANWQATDKEKFERAVALDAVTRDSPKWKSKPLEARFAHVAKMVAEEYDIQIPEDVKPQPTKGPSKADPVKAIAQATRTEPTTLSDFKGGAVDQTEERLERMTATAQLARVQDMSPEEFNEYLAKLG